MVPSLLSQSDLVSEVIAQGSVSKKTSRPFFFPAIVAGRKEKQTTNIPIENPVRKKIVCLKNKFAVSEKFVAISIISQRRTKKPFFSINVSGRIEYHVLGFLLF